MASENFFTAFTASVDQHKAATYNSRFNEIDLTISYMKNILLECDGNISATGGTLTWSGTIKIAYLDQDGNAIHNTIAANSVVLSTNQFAYVTLSAVNNQVLTVSTGTVTGGSTSTFKAKPLLVLAYRGDGDDVHPVALKPKYTVPSSAVSTLPHYYKGKPDVSGEVYRHVYDIETTYGAGWPLSAANARIQPSGEVLCYGHKNGVGCVRIIFDASQAATFSGESVIFSPGDIFTVIGPNPQDGNLEDIGFTFSGIV